MNTIPAVARILDAQKMHPIALTAHYDSPFNVSLRFAALERTISSKSAQLDSGT
jgi:hypothetical protein